jgi:class 3 adenylate cyclase/tetratricopeptide (TPR) repeat protein
VLCGDCGADNRAGARFCDACGAPLVEISHAREQRKTVTVLFCDVSGFTAIGDSLDPEALRHLLTRYAEQMRAIVESHGGIVEKFIGDAVMAVFGAPVVHEDDALRALRAATEMLEALPPLGIQGHLGVNSGEVVIGTRERLATGDAVNVAARLQGAAEPGQILLGEGTLRLVRDAVEVEPVAPLRVKGKLEPIKAYRLVSLTGDEPVARRLDTPFVGRARELGALREAYRRVVSDRRCHLVTILGAAGIGKSRLTAEFLSSLDDARVVQGRCLSYGVGITYWPVVEVVKQLRPADWKLEPGAADPLASLLGRDTPTSKDEIAFGVRRLFEAAAEEKPLVVVLDDLHWGEPTFLDLVEHVADWSRNAPILLLCLARPALLDDRPGWGAGKLGSSTLTLEPLGEAASERLLGHLLESANEDLATGAHILTVAEGNPLFVEEMVAMLRQASQGHLVVPPTIQALLAARLDQLTEGERVAAERGAIEGAVFHRTTVEAIGPNWVSAGDLAGLVRKQIVRPERPLFRDDDAFRFRHTLIRDAAYGVLPKATRADLHERFACWLETRAPNLVELTEVVGYHLEQAATCLSELGVRRDDLSLRAAEKLSGAGRVALEREDAPAAANLLGRAAALMPADSPDRARLLPLLGRALYDAGELDRADRVLCEAVELGERLGQPATEAHGRILRAHLRGHLLGGEGLRAIEEETVEAIAVLEELGDDRGLARAYITLGWAHFWDGRVSLERRDAERGLEHARRAGDIRAQAEALAGVIRALVFGPTPWKQVERFVEERVAPERARLGPRGAILGLPTLADAAAAQGRFDEAREIFARVRAHYEALGWRLALMTMSNQTGPAELLARDFDAAVAQLQPSYEALGKVGEGGYRARIAALLAEAVLEQGHLDEAIELATDAQALAGVNNADPSTLAVVLSVRARVASGRGDHEEATRFARDAVRTLRQMEYVGLQADTKRVLGEVLAAAGRPDEAASALSAALALYEQKGSTVLAERTRALLAHGAVAV